MNRIHILFVCSRNQWRSPTAEQVFRDDSRISVRSCGISRSSPRRISANDLNWADFVFVMENKHRRQIQSEFRNCLASKSIHVLDIPDDYQYMDPELVDLLTQSVEVLLQELL